MVIELNTDELRSSIRAISHREVAEIADVEARYRAEAGTEKLSEINRCIEDAAKRLEGRCYRFLANSIVTYSDNSHQDPEKYSYEFTLSERRAEGKTEPLKEAMNTFLINYALAKFYSNVSQIDLSNKHSLLALDAGNEIEKLLYTKQPPRV